MLVNITRAGDGSFSIDKQRRGLPGYDVTITDKAYKRLRKINAAFDMEATAQLEFMYVAARASALRDSPAVKSTTPEVRPVIAPERPPWRTGNEPKWSEVGVHHRPKPKLAHRKVIPVQPSAGKSSWNVERFKTIVPQEDDGNRILWDESRNKQIKRLNRIKGSTCNDKHLLVCGDLMSPTRWLHVVSNVLNGRNLWQRTSDMFELTMDATIELLHLHTERNR